LGENICKAKKHTQNPIEKLLLDVLQEILKKKSGKVPEWAKELKEIISGSD